MVTVEFELNGQKFVGLNGGPQFTFNEAISIQIPCADQDEVDYYWNRFTEDGGEPGPCGWVKDRFGVSWQVIPTVLHELMSDPDPAKAARATGAMLSMGKLDIAELRRPTRGVREPARGVTGGRRGGGAARPDRVRPPGPPGGTGGGGGGQAGRRGGEGRLDGLDQRQRRLLGQLDRDPRGRPVAGIGEVDVHRVLVAGVVRVVDVDRAVGQREPAGGALRRTVNWTFTVW